MNEEREINGTIKRWGVEVQAIKPGFYKLGLQLEEEGPKDWHNLTGASKEELEDLRLNFPVGGKVTFKEWENKTDRGTYWNYVKDSFAGASKEVQAESAEPETVSVDDMENPTNKEILAAIMDLKNYVEQKL